MKLPRMTFLVLGLGLILAGRAAGAVVTINELQYDLDQFAGAIVETSAESSEIFDSTFDNPNGIDGVTLGELAADQFGFDPGDRITLGYPIGEQQDWLTLTYDVPVTIGAGDLSKFVVFEQSGDLSSTADPEGQNFEISFDGGVSYVDASTSGSVTATGGVDDNGGTEQNQIVFDLLHPDFGFNVGDTIKTVTLRNLVYPGSGPAEYDPDFLFAARAGTTSTPIPEPHSVAVWLLFGCAAGLVGYRRRWR